MHGSYTIACGLASMDATLPSGWGTGGICVDIKSGQRPLVLQGLRCRLNTWTFSLLQYQIWSYATIFHRRTVLTAVLPV